LATKNKKLLDSIEEAIKSQKRPTITVLSSLLAIQDHIGYLPDEAISAVANSQNTSKNAVFNVASFYPNFRFTPPNINSVEVCWGPTCHLLGSSTLLKDILDTLELKKEGDTKDGKVSFRFNTCLGACSQGPVISINHELFGNITSSEATNLINELPTTKKKH
jgi:NADH:ubiquinone oxidoreductase subunit E